MCRRLQITRGSLSLRDTPAILENRRLPLTVLRGTLRSTVLVAIRGDSGSAGTI